MNKDMSKKTSLKWLCIFIAAELFLIALFTFVMDPFYQYHTPWFGMKQVLNDRDYQVVGTIRSNTYDSVLLGSSVAENFDSTYLDQLYNCSTLKVIRASGSVADLLYYMEKAHNNQEIRQVFWCLDIFALTASTEVTLYSQDTPRYLHTDTVLDDAEYLFNKDILFEKIPQNIAFSMLGTNTGGKAYDWSEDKEFSAAGAMRAYQKPDAVSEKKPDDGVDEAFIGLLEDNISLLETELQEHPGTKYTFLFPPYSMLWWDCGYVNGIAEQYFTVLQTVLPKLLSYENVSVHYFQHDREVICNLDNYMDMIHYSPAINQYMLDALPTGAYQVTSDNLDQVLQLMRDTFHYITEEGIYLYYDANAQNHN